MKAKELRAMLDQLPDEQEITFLGAWWDGDGYEGRMVIEESYQATLYLTEYDTVMIVPSDSEIDAVKKKFKGMALVDLLAILEKLKNKPLWLKLLEEKNDEDQETIR